MHTETSLGPIGQKSHCFRVMSTLSSEGNLVNRATTRRSWCNSYLQTTARIALAAFVMSVSPRLAEAEQDLLAACKASDVDAGILACSRLLEGNPAPDIAEIAHQTRGYKLMSKNDYAAAVQDLTAALAIKPTYQNILVARGNSYIALGQVDLARADFEAALKIKPDTASAYAGRSTVNYLSGDMDKTIADASEAIRLEPKQYAGYNNRGAALREKGDYDGAIRDLNIAIRLNPFTARPLYNRGLTSVRKGELRSALADYEAAIVLNPKETDAIRGRDAMKALLASSDPVSPAPASSKPMPVVPLPSVPASSAPGAAISAANAGSRAPTVGTEWSSFTAEKLGVRFLYEKANDPGEAYTYEENGDWVDKRPHSEGRAGTASHFIRVLNKPAGQPIEAALRERFIDTLPPTARATCRLRPYAPLSGADPAKPSFEIAPTGVDGRKLDERRRDPNAVSRPAGGCGEYGILEDDSYFEYHPNENKEKYLYVFAGFDASFDERSIIIRQATDPSAKISDAALAAPQGSIPEHIASELWAVSLNANSLGSLYCEALLKGQNQELGGAYTIRYRVETARQGHLVVTYSGAKMKDVAQVSTALDGRPFNSFLAKPTMYGKDNAVVADVDPAAFKDQELAAFAKPDASFLQLTVGNRIFEVPVRGYASINANLDACIGRLPRPK